MCEWDDFAIFSSHFVGGLPQVLAQENIWLEGDGG